MRRVVLSLVVILATLPGMAAKPVKIAQLEKEVGAVREKHDGDAARHISRLELTERLTRNEFERLKEELPGEQSRAALAAVADLAAFLPTSPDEILLDTAPDVDEQRRILKGTVDYLSRKLPTLPSFVARKSTLRFEEQPLGDAEPGPMLWAGRLDEQVSFEDGKEVLKPVNIAEGGHKGDAELAAEVGLRTWGEFGPILTLVLSDALHNAIAWRGWEKNEGGRMAVFVFAVSSKASHYHVDYCCMHDAGGELRRFQTVAGYRGEMALDPESGAVLRLQIHAELGSNDPVKSSDLLVEYGNVEIGGRMFTCPLRSVALFKVRPETGRDLNMLPAARRRLVIGGATDAFLVGDRALINDAEFTDYHQFRSDVRIVSESADPLDSRSSAGARSQPNDPETRKPEEPRD